MTSERNCFVYIVLPGATDFVTAARFQIRQTRGGEMLGELVYGKNYLSRSDAVELDPVELKLATKQYQTVLMNGFFGAIRDAMPDYWGRRVIDHGAGGVHEDFDYLMLGPDDRAGALGFGLNNIPPAPRRAFNQTLDITVLQQTAEIIMRDGSIEQLSNQSEARQIQALLLEGTSMGGARPKAVVEDKDGLWIAKFSSPQDRWNQPVIEHTMLNLAKKCGLHAAESKLVTVAGKSVLLVKRFDREKADKGYFRHRMVSALTLLKSDEDTLARERWSYLLLADEIRRISSNPKADLHELFGRMCFNALISNLDDHPRNHAVIAPGKNWQLSPAYDLTPTPSVAKDRRFLAMACGADGRLANRSNLLSTANRFMLSNEEAENIINKMTKVVQNEWYAALRKAGASEQDCSQVASAFVYDGFFNEE